MTLPNPNSPEFLRGYEDAQHASDPVVYVFPEGDYQAGWNAARRAAQPR